MDVKPLNVRNRNSTTTAFVGEFNNFASLQDYRNAFEKFKNENGHYPSSIEIDATPYFPNCKTITRKFGGVRKLRELLNLEGGEVDHRMGEKRANMATSKTLMAFNDELEVYNLLVSQYGEVNVHRQAPYVSHRMLRADFKVFLPSGRNVFIDTFYPENKQSLFGCLSSKQKKLKDISVDGDISFVVMNKNMSQEFIDSLIGRRKSVLEGIKVLSYNNFIHG